MVKDPLQIWVKIFVVTWFEKFNFEYRTIKNIEEKEKDFSDECRSCFYAIFPQYNYTNTSSSSSRVYSYFLSYGIRNFLNFHKFFNTLLKHKYLIKRKHNGGEYKVSYKLDFNEMKKEIILLKLNQEQ